MGAQNFNFDPKFPQHNCFSASKFAFFDEKFVTRRRFSDSPKFRGASGHDATDCPPKYEAAPLPFVVSGAPASSVIEVTFVVNDSPRLTYCETLLQLHCSACHCC